MSREWPFEGCDRNGRRLRITPGDGCALVYAGDGEVRVPAPELPSVAAAIYGAAGQPEPVILDRPAGPALALSVIPGLKFTVRDGGVDVERPGSGWLAEPDVIRHLAAALAMLADEAENEPDPAEVETLAAIIAARRKRGPALCEPDREDARAILRAGYVKREETP